MKFLSFFVIVDQSLGLGSNIEIKFLIFIDNNIFILIVYISAPPPVKEEELRFRKLAIMPINSTYSIQFWGDGDYKVQDLQPFLVLRI